MEGLIVVMVIGWPILLIAIAALVLHARGQTGIQHGDRGQRDRTAGEVGARTAELFRDHQHPGG